MDFRNFILPTDSFLIPSDIELKLPESSSLNTDKMHYLIYIPWHDKYLSLIDIKYREIFLTALTFLHKRTTDVHVATCMPFIKEFTSAYNESFDEKVVNIAFILHDSGWSQMSDEEIASSLGVTGLALNIDAISPKERHAILGRKIATQILEHEPYASQLTSKQKELIYTTILFHDKPWELAIHRTIPIEMKVVCDVDHLWSFTHENFWQDTIRKKVNPPDYLKNLKMDLAGYFITERGKEKAEILLSERKVEVEAWAKVVSRRN